LHPYLHDYLSHFAIRRGMSYDKTPV